MENILDQIEMLGVVPVVTIEAVQDAPMLAQALVEGGLPCAEVTFRTAAAEEAIRKMVTRTPDVLVGAGTVQTIDQAGKAMDAGAKFMVTPGFDEEIVDFCLAEGMPIIPGVVTPTEINMALRKGLRVLKFFPAEVSGGVKMLKAIGGPYPEVRFMPTGGINLTNVADYLALPQVVACGGSWMVRKQLIRDGEFEQITKLAHEAAALVQQVRR